MLKLAGAGAAFAFLFHFVHFEQVFAVLSAANPLLVALGVLMFLAGQVVAAARWRQILRSDAVHISLRNALHMNLIGTFAGNFLPGMATGDLAKSALLFQPFPEKRSFLIASVVYDRITGLVSVVVIAGAGALILGISRGNWSFIPYVAAATAAVFLGIWFIASVGTKARLLRVMPSSLIERSSLFIEGLRRLLRNKQLFGTALWFGLGFQSSGIISLWIMLCAIQPGAPFLPVMVAAPFALVVAMLPITINGLGLREGTFSYILQHLGVDAQIAVATSLLGLLPLLVSSLLGGVLLVFGKNRNGK